MTSWRNLYCVLFLALTGAPGLEAWLQITWYNEVTAGFSKTFQCSSYCRVNCTYTWSLLGHTVTGNTLVWTPDGRDKRVELTCRVFSPKTGGIGTTSIIDVKNPLSVQISPPNTVPSLNRSLDLVCHDDTSGLLLDKSHLVVWFKNGQEVTQRGNTRTHRVNHTLHFDSLLPSDAGFYQCERYLSSKRDSGVFSLGYHLSFDPWSVNISGPDTVLTGGLGKFTCLPSCTLNVDCTVRWVFRGSFPVGKHFSVHGTELQWIPSVPGTSQNFTCVAENPAAGRYAEATKTVEVKDFLLSGSDTIKLRGLSSIIIGLGLLVLF